ncbi:MAG: DNA translocase FtsK 4TM domain-containing protein, partial [Flavobacteriales bacterium]
MAEKSKKNSSSNSSLKSFLQDPRVKKIGGFLLLSFSIYLFLACLSYVFTGGHDQHLIRGTSKVESFSDQEPYRNWMGKAGAHLAHFFMFKYLGVGSFFIAFMCFLYGVKIAFQKSLLPLFKSLRLSILGALYFPLLIGFFFHNRVDGFDRKIEITCNDRFVGGYGHFATEYITFNLGWWGTLMLLLVVALAYMIFNHNHKVEAAFSRIGEWMKREPEQEQEQGTGEQGT